MLGIMDANIYLKIQNNTTTKPIIRNELNKLNQNRMKEDDFINSVINSFLNGKKGVNWMCPLPDSPWAYSDQIVWAREAADILIKKPAREIIG